MDSVDGSNKGEKRYKIGIDFLVESDSEVKMKGFVSVLRQEAGSSDISEKQENSISRCVKQAWNRCLGSHPEAM